jgi:hypothetical protein
LFFSDGAASQFKQKFLSCNLTFMRASYGLDVQWHFFASGHGKGVMDGIGGSVKRVVWNEIRTGNCITCAD